MIEEKPRKAYRKTPKNLTKNGKRLGRPRNNHTPDQHCHPLGKDEQPSLTTLDIIRAVLSSTRPKYAAALASLTEAKPHDAKAVKRVSKRLERDRQRISKLRGVNKI